MRKSTIRRAKQTAGHAAGERAAKKRYVSPQLVEYGNVAKLTSSNGTRNPEGNGTFQREL